jgi:endoglucanase
MPMELTHQRVMAEYAEPLAYGPAQAEALLESLEAIDVFDHKLGAPIYMGEFGINRNAPGDSATRYVSDAIDAFEARGWSYSYHEYRGYVDWDPEVAGAEYVRTADAPMAQLLRARFARPL